MAGSNESETAASLKDFRAELDVFSGPLDLLLHLIKQEEVDIFEVAVSRITDRYLAALRAVDIFDVNVAAEFLVVAATLMEMKSKTLLPPGETEEEEDDPGVELVRRLLQYKAFKEAAEDLQNRRGRRIARFSRPPPDREPAEQPGPEALLEDLSAWDLMSAFAEVARQTRLEQPVRVLRGRVPVSDYVEEVLRQLEESGGEAAFLDFFRSDCSRERVIGIFLAILELIRRDKIYVEQPSNDVREIRVLFRSDTAPSVEA